MTGICYIFGQNTKYPIYVNEIHAPARKVT
jgi:hypothetical protein